MISDQEFLNIARAELKEAIGYSGENSALHENRRFLMDSYNTEPYGDEIEGRSQVITADVFEVVEGQLPTLVDMFSQDQDVAKFKQTSDEYKQEAEEKQALANWVFTDQHKPTCLLHSQLKDSLLQYTGILEVYWDDSEELQDELEFTGQSPDSLISLGLREDLEIEEVQEEENGLTIKAKSINKNGRARIESVPPNEFVISKRARSFDDTPLIGKITPKTRSDLIRMGFDKEKVKNLNRGEGQTDSVGTARTRDLGGNVDVNPTEDRSKDIVNLAKLYIKLDADEDGIEEMWLIYFAYEGDSSEILSKEKVNMHPYSVANLIPMPNKAIGTCDAAQVADYQYWKTTLVRNLNDNIYSNNHSRVIANELVNYDDLLTARHGGAVRYKGKGPVTGSAMPLVVPMQVNEILSAIELVDMMIERRTGVTRFNQGLEAENLTNTVGGFKGISRLSHRRMRLKAQIYADQALQPLFEKIIRLYEMHQKEGFMISVNGNPTPINPMNWKDKTKCTVIVGTNAIDEQNHLLNLNGLLERQRQERAEGSPLVDNKKIYNTYSEIVKALEVGSSGTFFNDPEVPQELLMAEVEKLYRENQALQQQSQNMLAEAELIKQQATTERELLKIQTKAQFDLLAAQQQQTQHDDKMAVELTKIEAQTNKDVPGALI